MNLKSKTTAVLLCFFLGGFGAHKFYLGRTTAGIFYLFFCWTFIPAILSFIDLLSLAFTDQERFNKMYN